jgi:hypothetical protein
MKTLKFTDPTLQKGLQNTIRRGTKWDGESGLVNIAPTCTPEHPDELKTGNIKYTQAMRFSDVDYDTVKKGDNYYSPLWFHHTGHQDGASVAEMMHECYPNFSEDEIVTIVWFEVVE